MIAAVIPARGGSKGIHKKNIMPLMGKPLIAWTIEAARASKLVDEVLVSTDCDEICNFVLYNYDGVYVTHRPDDISGDDATSESTLLHVNEGWDIIHLEQPELLVMLQPTSPIRQPKDIDNAIELLHQTGADSLYSSRQVEGFVWRGGNNTTLRPLGYSPSSRPRRQELREISVEENGSIYITRAAALLESKCRLSGNVVTYPMHALDSFQIDQPSDVGLIESLWDIRMSHTRECAVC